MNGAPLPAAHGFPLRLIVPGWYGMASVKWLRSIAAVAEPFEGVQQTLLYNFRRSADEPGEHELCVRATDAAGNSQPQHPDDGWNMSGYAVNAVQRVPVRVAA